jgi:small subunit ribosomal protein S4
MSKIGPRLRLVRKLGDLPGLTRKVSNKPNTPGQHGQLRSKLVRNMSPYALRLLEKQNYVLIIILLSVNYYVMLFKLKKSTGSTGEVLLELQKCD